MYTLTISDTVDFPVTIAVNDAGTAREFPMRLQARRISEDALLKLQLENPSQPTAEFLAEHITDWRDQALIATADGQAADCTPEALALLLGVGGAAQTIFLAYRRALAGAGGLEGRAKNSHAPRASGHAAA